MKDNENYKKYKIKYIANSITVSRIVGSLLLLLLPPMSVAFFSVYSACGVSDMLDGYVARKTNSVSKLGSVLDSAADFIFIVVLLVVFIPILNWEMWMLFWIGIIAFIRLVSFGIGFIKYRAAAFLHTYANKATGMALFFFPLLYYVTGLKLTFIILCSIATLSALEEIMTMIHSKKLNLDIRSLFLK